MTPFTTLVTFGKPIGEKREPLHILMSD